MVFCIVYPNGQGGLNILSPTGVLSLEETAKRDVPAGLPYKIVPLSDLPPDSAFASAWEMDFSTPDGHGIGHQEWDNKHGEVK